MDDGKEAGILKIFFIADTHFDDVNILHYENSPFKTVEEMNGVLIENWNRTVSSQSYCVSVERIGYTPILFEDVKRAVQGYHDE